MYAHVLTLLDVAGCPLLTARSINFALLHSPLLVNVCLRGLSGVRPATLWVLSPGHSPNLAQLDVSQCPNLAASALAFLGRPVDNHEQSQSKLQVLKAAGLFGWTDETIVRVVGALPNLRHFDLSHSTGLTDAGFDAALTVDKGTTGAVFITTEGTLPCWRRKVGWEVLKLSGCRGLSGACVRSLVGAVPHLRVLELADVPLGSGRSLVALLSDSGGLPCLERLDLEGGAALSPRVLAPLQAPHGASSGALTHLILSGCFSLPATALQALIESAPRLKHLEADGTALSPGAVVEFVRRQRVREHRGAMISALDGTAVTTRFIKEKISKGEVRTRSGWRGEAVIGMGYLEERESRGQARVEATLDEVDPGRVTVRSYAAHLAVDKAEERVRRTREKHAAAAAAAEAEAARSGRGGGERGATGVDHLRLDGYVAESLRGSCCVQ